MIMNKKWIIILICTGVTLLLGSLGITFYAVSRMNRVEELLVFTTETETTEESTTITSVVTTETTTTTIVTTSPEVTTMTEELDVIESVPNNNNNNNDAMTRNQWYQENGYSGYPYEQETDIERDEYLYIKNNNTYMGEFKVKVEYVGYSGIYIGSSRVNASEGDAVAGVDTGLNIGDKIYVPGCGYFTIVHLTDTVIFEKDDSIVCFVDADELLYGPDGYILGYFDTEVYLIE